MNKISLKRSRHRDNEVILLLFDYDLRLIDKVKLIPNSKWSQSKGCWYIPFRDNYRDYLLQYIDEDCFVKREKLSDKNNSNKKGEDINPYPIIEKYMRYLENKRYSESSIRNYVSHIKHFLMFFKDKNR